MGNFTEEHSASPMHMDVCVCMCSVDMKFKEDSFWFAIKSNCKYLKIITGYVTDFSLKPSYNILKIIFFPSSGFSKLNS